jgi:hypothetical protein
MIVARALAPEIRVQRGTRRGIGWQRLDYSLVVSLALAKTCFHSHAIERALACSEHCVRRQ